MSRRRRPPRRRPLTTVFEDASWLAVSKPAGVPVHGGAGKNGPSVLERLEESHGPGPLHLVHRLDRGTSGLLLLAKAPDAARLASAAWPSVRKTYWAVALGRPVAPRLIDVSLTDPDGRSREARTELAWSRAVSGLIPEVSLCQLHLQTGRLHQIRRHLAAIGHPVLLDEKYGNFEVNKTFASAMQADGLPKPKHLFLACIGLEAPRASGLPPRLESDPPGSWTSLLDRIGDPVDEGPDLA